MKKSSKKLGKSNSAPDTTGNSHTHETEDDRASSRIAQTALRILAQARQSLPPEESPKRIRSIEPVVPFNIPDLFSSIHEEERHRLVEVTDESGAVILCMPIKDALRQGLRLRMVCLVLRSSNANVMLHKRPASELGYPGCWDFYTDLVHAGEATEDAALRMLSAMAGLGGQTVPKEIQECTEYEIIQQKGKSRNDASARHKSTVQITFYEAEVPQGLQPEEKPEDILEVDKDELEGLTASMPELLTPEVLWAMQSVKLF